MITDRLYDLCEAEGISVICGAHLPTVKSASVAVDGRYYIGIDDSAMSTAAEERVHLAHEYGHCHTGAFYPCGAIRSNRSRCEYIANACAVRQLIDRSELEAQIIEAGGEVRTWELAEYFDVTEDFVRLALRVYFDFTA